MIRPHSVDVASALAAARRVIDIEAHAVASLDKVLDDTFLEAVDLLIKARGRVVVSAVGKSGHIGRKLAATLSATGTPAYFVHAGEASHGDLGTICRDDVLVVLSVSGSTAELRAVMRFAESINVPIIGITAHREAPLMRKIDVCIVLPSHNEACPVQIAPTTSTTMMLALGDALAIAAMDRRGVTRDEVVELHPGGAIGARNMSIDTLLEPALPLPLVKRDAEMREVVIGMSGAGKGIAGVIDHNGQLIGAITDGDIRRHFDNILTSRAENVMTLEPIVLASDMRIDDALSLLQKWRITAAFVVHTEQPRRPIGLVNIHDLSAGLLPRP